MALTTKSRPAVSAKRPENREFTVCTAHFLYHIRAHPRCMSFFTHSPRHPQEPFYRAIGPIVKNRRRNEPCLVPRSTVVIVFPRLWSGAERHSSFKPFRIGREDSTCVTPDARLRFHPGTFQGDRRSPSLRPSFQCSSTLVHLPPSNSQVGLSRRSRQPCARAAGSTPYRS